MPCIAMASSYSSCCRLWIKYAHTNNPASLSNSIPSLHSLPLLSSYLHWNTHRFLRLPWTPFTNFQASYSWFRIASFQQCWIFLLQTACHKTGSSVRKHFHVSILSFRRVLYVVCFLWVFPRRLRFKIRRFGTLYRSHLPKHLSRKMEPIEDSETSAFKPKTPGKYPKENILETFSSLFF